MQSPLIVALDFETKLEAMDLVRQLGAESRFYKVGLQLLAEEGPSIVRELVAMGKEVFLDLKLHEIPNSIIGGISAAGKLGASMVTVHASGGSAVLKAAVTAAAPYPSLKVLALTVITSLSDSDLPEIGLPPSVERHVDLLSQLAANCGCHGVIASAREAARLSKRLPSGLLIVTPGIQLRGAAGNDQVRVATAAIARQNGATHVVIGRPITRASNPREAFAEAWAGIQHPSGA